MPQNFICTDRDQLMLMPVDVRDWLDEDDLVWHVLDVVGQLDLSAFYRRYRANGQGAAALRSGDDGRPGDLRAGGRGALVAGD